MVSVHRNVFGPGSKPLTAVLNRASSAKTPAPPITVHRPVPPYIDGSVAEKTKVPSQVSSSVPASTLIGVSFVISTLSVLVQPSIVTCQVNVVAPKGKFDTVAVADVELSKITVASEEVQYPDPGEGFEPLSNADPQTVCGAPASAGTY